jgi:hypothetical protein
MKAILGSSSEHRALLRTIAKANGLIKVLLEPNQGCSRIGTASSNSFPLRQNSLECLGFSEELNEITRTRAAARARHWGPFQVEGSPARSAHNHEQYLPSGTRFSCLCLKAVPQYWYPQRFGFSRSCEILNPSYTCSGHFSQPFTLLIRNRSLV